MRRAACGRVSGWPTGRPGPGWACCGRQAAACSLRARRRRLVGGWVLHCTSDGAVYCSDVLAQLDLRSASAGCCSPLLCLCGAAAAMPPPRGPESPIMPLAGPTYPRTGSSSSGCNERGSVECGR